MMQVLAVFVVDISGGGDQPDDALSLLHPKRTLEPLSPLEWATESDSKYW